MRRAKDKQVFPERAQLADEFIILDAIDGKESAVFEDWVLAAELSLLLSLILNLGFVDGLCGDIVFGSVAHAEHDMLYRAVVVECNADDILETLGEIVRAIGVLLFRQRLDRINTVEGESKNLPITVGCSEEEPAVVALLQQIRMEVNASDGCISKSVIGKTDDHLVGNLVEERA